MPEKYIVHNEDILGSINGETPSGSQMILGKDVLIYFKIVGVEQPTLNRLRANKDATNLYNEIDAVKGKVYLGEPEAVLQELKLSIDKLFEAIKNFREKNEKQN